MTLRAWRLAHGYDMAQAAAALGIGLRAYYLLERATANDNGRRRRIRAGP